MIKFALFILIVFSAISLGCSEPTESVSDEIKGFTRTDGSGQIIVADNDDWRTQERYRNQVTVKPAYPNPTTNFQVSIPIQFYNFVSSTAIFISSTNTAGFQVSFYSNTSVTNNTTVIFPIDLTRLSPTGNVAELKGKLFRIYFRDTAGNLISYGDVQIE